MTKFENKIIDKKIIQPNIPKTYEQFVLEEKNLDQQNLYPDLTHGDISIQKSYGPGLTVPRGVKTFNRPLPVSGGSSVAQPLNGNCTPDCLYSIENRQWICSRHNYFGQVNTINSSNASVPQTYYCSYSQCWNIVSGYGGLCSVHRG